METKIQELRKANKISQAELADEMGVTRQTIISLEKGRYNASLELAFKIARYFGMSERFIGLTIVAFGTSLPELVTSVMAAKKGNVGIAIGNIVGSNIFNILFVIGTTALICTVPFEPKFLIDSGVAVFSGILLWVGTFRHKELRRSCGIVMLLCYAAYFAYLCM